MKEEREDSVESKLSKMKTLSWILLCFELGWHWRNQRRLNVLVVLSEFKKERKQQQHYAEAFCDLPQP